MKKNILYLLFLAVAVTSLSVFLSREHKRTPSLLWFIPDGIRGDWLFELAREGYLPNIKKMMDNGTSAYSIPAFPSHTPTNYATLRTGCYPEVHGVSDGAIRPAGAYLTKPVPGFSSLASRTPALWDILEKNNKHVIVFSIPGSTPPELKNGITIRGRWSGWGVETPPVLFTTDKVNLNVISIAGFNLTKDIEFTKPAGWEKVPQNYDTAPKEIKLSAHGADLYGYIYDSIDDKSAKYDSIVFAVDKKTPLVVLRPGQWSQWLPLELKQEKADIKTFVKIKIIRLSGDGKDLRIRFYFNSLNRLLVEPQYVYDELMSSTAGPAVDFVDDWPHQLTEDGDYETFKEESNMSLDWHKKAVSFLFKKYKGYCMIHCIYTPNQFMEAPFWMGHVDPTNKRVFDPRDKEKYWNDIINLYQQMDAIVGEYLKNAGQDTIIAFSSDHGIAPLHRMVRLNGLFAKKGWLHCTRDNKTGKTVIDWERSKVIYLKMAYIYINPEGFGKNGFWKRSHGDKYEALRDEVIKSLYSLQDTDGGKPLNFAKKWEEADFLKLPKDRIGDIIISARPPYAWTEDIGEDQNIFVDSKDTGYKQTVDPQDKNIVTPFIIAGPGIRKGFKMDQIHHVDQVPTFLRLMGIKIPEYIQGRVLSEMIVNEPKK
ncbi:MAG: alkaline phosphatase family protein [Elusimicrobia bacterium]|nr:alkaline phosphatase family protein [Candidatus Liberimonas magnetica]